MEERVFEYNDVQYVEKEVGVNESGIASCSGCEFLNIHPDCSNLKKLGIPHCTACCREDHKNVIFVKKER